MSGHGNNNRRLVLGLVLLASFVAVLVLIFLPLYGGQNGLDYLDNTYNAISKASAYYIPKVLEEGEEYAGQEFKVTLVFDRPEEAQRAETLFKAAGAATELGGPELKVSGGLLPVMKVCLADAEDVYRNQADKLKERYQMEGRLALYTWYLSLKAMIKDLNRQKSFAQVRFVDEVQSKAVETAYNFHGIQGQSIKERWGVVSCPWPFMCCTLYGTDSR
ncbi:MAG: hypothetical protein AB1896_22240 [Thermodesulfobacteriota bacterium]